MAVVQVAFLRGINVGTAKRIAMADLRRVFERLGCRDVHTVLNSGNVVFIPPDAGLTVASIEQAIATKLKVDSRVTLLTGHDLARAVRSNPLAKVAVHPPRMLVMVLRDLKAAARLKPLLQRPWTPEALAVRGRSAYLWCANGIGVSPLWEAVTREVGQDGTARNLATMTRVLALVKS